MANFPTLKTGAVMQYPATLELRYTTQIVKFLDGTEQRFCEYRVPLHRWAIQLDQLDETELDSFREFFRIMDGGSEPFSFTDPWDNQVYQSCSIDTDAMVEILTGEGQAKTAFVIRENR